LTLTICFNIQKIYIYIYIFFFTHVQLSFFLLNNHWRKTIIIVVHAINLKFAYFVYNVFNVIYCFSYLLFFFIYSLKMTTFKEGILETYEIIIYVYNIWITLVQLTSLAHQFSFISFLWFLIYWWIYFVLKFFYLSLRLIKYFWSLLFLIWINHLILWILLNLKIEEISFFSSGNYSHGLNVETT